MLAAGRRRLRYRPRLPRRNQPATLLGESSSSLRAAPPVTLRTRKACQGKDLTDSTFVKGQSDAQLVDFIKKGRPTSDPANTTKIEMPPKGGNPALTDGQLADITAFMRTLRR